MTNFMWPDNFLALWLCCLVALWPYGFWPCCLVRLWVCCLVALWPCGLVAFVALWPCGLVALLPCGFVALNLCCLVAVLPGAFAALWLCGFVALWPCGLEALWPRSLVAFWPCGFVSGPGFGIVTLCLAFACRLVALLPGPEGFGAGRTVRSSREWGRLLPNVIGIAEGSRPQERLSRQK